MSQHDFDPVHALVRAQFEKPTALSPVNLRVLSPSQRALLVIDGTVTKFIEAYTMEPVEIVRVAQENTRLPEANARLEVPAGTEVAFRQVLIQGRYSRTPFVYAVSLVVLERLTPEVRERLEVDGEGIGRILNDVKLETRRELLWYGREHVDDLPEDVRQVTTGEFITREYRIIANGRPIALINEKFPFGLDLLPSHE